MLAGRIELGHRRGLLALVALTLAAHLALLGGIDVSLLPQRDASRAAALQVRTLTMAAAPPADAAPPAPVPATPEPARKPGRGRRLRVQRRPRRPRRLRRPWSSPRTKRRCSTAAARPIRRPCRGADRGGTSRASRIGSGTRWRSRSHAAAALRHPPAAAADAALRTAPWPLERRRRISCGGPRAGATACASKAR